MSAIVDNVLPVFALIALGQALLRFKLVDESFYRTSDKLVYFIFFPALLFWKIGSASSVAGEAGELAAMDAVPAVLLAIVIVWALGLVYIKLARVPAFQAGTFSQITVRFNSYVGMAVVIGAFGEAGAASFGIYIGFAIPLINVLIIAALIWFSQADYGPGQKARLLSKALVTNPLIIGCAAGIAWAHLEMPLPVFVDNTFKLMAAITLPLALLAIGGWLDLGRLKGQLTAGLPANLFKLVALPAVGFGVLRAMHIDGLPFAVAMIYFALPASTATHILSSQLGSDTRLAVSSVVLSTLLSIISLSLILVLFA